MESVRRTVFSGFYNKTSTICMRAEDVLPLFGCVVFGENVIFSLILP